MIKIYTLIAGLINKERGSVGRNTLPMCDKRRRIIGIWTEWCLRALVGVDSAVFHADVGRGNDVLEVLPMLGFQLGEY